MGSREQSFQPRSARRRLPTARGILRSRSPFARPLARSACLAAALDRETRTTAIFRRLPFLGQVLSATVVTLIRQIALSPRRRPVANVVGVFGGSPINSLTEERFATLMFVRTTVRWSLGIATILSLAGLRNVSREIRETAGHDDASGWRGFLSITLPNSPMLLSSDGRRAGGMTP